MKRILLATLAALALSTSGFALSAATAQSDQQPSHAERMQHWAADRETLLDAKLAGMKAGLGLNADQEKLWGPFESAVQDAAKARMEAMQQMMQARMQGEHVSPVDRLDALADRLTQGAADIKKIADAAKPLYAGLDASQKEKFALLGRDMLIPQRARFAMEMWRHHQGELGQGDNGQ
jgi:zinc resistance-associated protein